MQSSKKKILATATDTELAAAKYLWEFEARPEQLTPEVAWSVWLILAGRGWGKTRTGAAWIIERAERGEGERLALVGRTAADVRDVMIEGESGILAKSPPWFRPDYLPSKRRLQWPNGAQAFTYSGDKPDQLRGPQHTGAWADEPAAWRYPETWDQLELGMRLGSNPQIVATTTPRPTELIRTLVADPDTYLTRGHTLDNAANLAPKFLKRIMERYDGTRLGRQELSGEVLDDNPGALWRRLWIDTARVTAAPAMRRIIVAVDPSVGGAAETGIVVVGLGVDGDIYVLDDASIHGTAHAWAEAAITAYHRHSANLIVGEINNGGDLVERNIKTVDERVPFESVRASRGKETRAEPVAALTEQGRVHFVGVFPELEDQLTQWDPLGSSRSPDRLDAFVWGVTELDVTSNRTSRRRPDRRRFHGYRMGVGRGF